MSHTFSVFRALVRRVSHGMQSLLPALSPHDLLRDTNYPRLWTSVLLSSLGGQVTLLALPLSAVVLLKATPTQMGYLTTMELLPFLLLSLPVGVWLDRVRKLPVYRWGEALVAMVLASATLAWALGYLSMNYLYVVAFATGCVFVTAGTAAQIVLTQVVARDRLLEAYAKNALASSGAEVVGPGLAGALIELIGAPLSLLADALMLVTSVLILRDLKVSEEPPGTAPTHFWRDLREGLRFVARQRLLLVIAFTVGLWQVALQCAMVVQMMFATRLLGLSEHGVGLCYVGLGAGTVLASVFGHRISRRIGPGPCLILGLALNGAGWLQLALAPTGHWGVAAFVLMFVNFLALRQSVTPAALLGRYLGEHWGLRYATGLGGVAALLLAVWAWFCSGLHQVRMLPLFTD